VRAVHYAARGTFTHRGPGDALGGGARRSIWIGRFGRPASGGLSAEPAPVQQGYYP